MVGLQTPQFLYPFDSALFIVLVFRAIEPLPNKVFKLAQRRQKIAGARSRHTSRAMIFFIVVFLLLSHVFLPEAFREREKTRFLA